MGGSTEGVLASRVRANNGKKTANEAREAIRELAEWEGKGGCAVVHSP